MDKIFKINESYKNKKITNNFVEELCICILLVKNDFLDNILDKGIKSKYIENSDIFLKHLKNILLFKNNVKLGKYKNNKCVVDDDISKINNIFKNIDFDIERDWEILINSRIIARNIIDKLLPEDKLTPEKIKMVYLIGPNKDYEHNEDIVIELNNGEQLPVYINKNISKQKTLSFNTFFDELFKSETDFFNNDEYIKMWDDLTKKWFKIIYKNANDEIKSIIKKYLNIRKLSQLNYKNYFDMKHSNPNYKENGEYIKKFNKFILMLNDLMNEIWKNKDKFIKNHIEVEKKWNEYKNNILNDKIIKQIINNELYKKYSKDMKKIKNGYILAEGRLKLRLIKFIINKLGCNNKTFYYFYNNGNYFNTIPKTEFFKRNYKKLNVVFKQYIDKDVNDNSVYNIKILLYFKTNKLLELVLKIDLSGRGYSGKLNVKYNFNTPYDFNYRILKATYNSDDFNS